MKKFLVTGANSFLGSHVVLELAKQGLPIRGIIRPELSSNKIQSDFLIEGLDLEMIAVDPLDRNKIRDCLENVQTVFHTDQLLSFSPKDKKRLYQIHHQDTKNLLEASLNLGIEKVVYTAGMETLRPPPGRDVATEEDGVAESDLHTDFEKSRYYGEREAMRLEQKGLPLVFVHPTVCIGKGENLETPFGRYLARFLLKRFFYFLETGFNLVGVEDVAKGHLLAAKRGESGSRYILGNKNLYLMEIFELLMKITKRPIPNTVLPPGMAQFAAFFTRWRTAKNLRTPKEILRILKKPLFYDCYRAHRNLGMPASNIQIDLQVQIDEIRKKLSTQIQ